MTFLTVPVAMVLTSNPSRTRVADRLVCSRGEIDHAERRHEL
jgi:hypothetical protein